MEWFKLTADFYRDPALRAADREARGARDLFLNGLGYCTEQDTAGHLPAHALSTLDVPAPARKVAALVSHGLLLPNGDGWDYRSWDRHQGGMDALVRRQAADRERQRLARLRKKEGQSADASRDSQQDDPRDVGRDLEVEVEEEKKTSSSSPRKRAKQATLAPDILPLSPEMAEWGRTNAANVDPRVETPRFLDWHRAKATKHADWVAAWRNWMRKAQQDAEKARTVLDESLLNPHDEWRRSNR